MTTSLQVTGKYKNTGKKQSMSQLAISGSGELFTCPQLCCSPSHYLLAHLTLKFAQCSKSANSPSLRPMSCQKHHHLLLPNLTIWTTSKFAQRLKIRQLAIIHFVWRVLWTPSSSASPRVMWIYNITCRMFQDLRRHQYYTFFIFNTAKKCDLFHYFLLILSFNHYCDERSKIICPRIQRTNHPQAIEPQKAVFELTFIFW